MNLTQYKVGDLGEIFDGPHATPKRQDVGPYFLNISSLVNGRLDLTQSDHVTREDFTRWTKRVTPQEGDLLFSYETRLGEAALMPGGVEACLGRRMALLRPNRKIADPRFLLYFYLSPIFQDLVQRFTIHGATVNRIGLSTMGSWPVAIPEISEQRAVADVLGALDDKTVVNTTVSRTACRMADLIFAESVRELPFSSFTFADVASVGGGATPSTRISHYWDGDIRWATPTDVTSLEGPYLESTARRITKAGLDSCASPLYPPGSILMTSRATIGAFAISQTPVAVNQGFIVVNPHDNGLKWWILHEMSSRLNELLSHSNGATFLELSRGRFRKLPIRLGDRQQMKNFCEKVDALHGRSRAALVENSRLATVRDALLPELMSGRIRVKDAEERVEEVL